MSLHSLKYNTRFKINLQVLNIVFCCYFQYKKDLAVLNASTKKGTVIDVHKERLFS